MLKPGERHHPFFDPLWRRIAVVVIVALWFAFEVLVTQQSLWMAIAGAMTLYAVYTFLIAWPKEPPPSRP